MTQTRHDISFTAIVTTTIWASCLAVGFIGIVLPYARPVLAKKADVPIQAEILNIELTNDPLPPDAPAQAPQVLTPPPEAKPIAPPTAPALIPVAAPNPAIAFAVPVAGPTRVVEAKDASYATANDAAREDASPQIPVTQLTFGLGEGKQPAPIYPPRAANEGQEGSVSVLFTIGPDGRTVAPELTARSPWPLLNEAALKVIRERWRFAPGPIRRHTITLHFKLRK